MKRAILLMALLAASGCGSANPIAPTTSAGVFTKTDLVVGTGATAVAGGRATVAFTGWLYDTSKPAGKGTQFDSGTFAFTIGAGQVLRGFDQGVVDMKVGGQRRLIIPPELAYANNPPSGSGIPVNATLVFDITLSSIS